MTTSGDVRVLHWWAEPGLLLAGCVDEQVNAFDDYGQRKWEFTSVMDPAVYEAGKTYWFKSAYPGIYGLYSGSFDNGKNRADLNYDGNREVVSAINGTWNRVKIYSECGDPLYNAQFGPVVREPRANIRMMDIDDFSGDGKKEKQHLCNVLLKSAVQFPRVFLAERIMPKILCFLYFGRR